MTTLRKHSCNAAADEIARRVKADPVFQVQTIHSFAWSLIEARHRGRFALGLLGDTMQRIHTDDLRGLDQGVGDFAQPAKLMDHRSRARIVDLANSIQSDADGRQHGRVQKSRVAPYASF